MRWMTWAAIQCIALDDVACNIKALGDEAGTILCVV
jgi:hypothetical protein